MEDAHTVHLGLKGDKSSAYFGVFDGHGSALFAEYCSQNLHESITDSKEFGKWHKTSWPVGETQVGQCLFFVDIVVVRVSGRRGVF